MAERLQVAALTAGARDPSARFRVGQLAGPLAAHGVDVDWRPAPVSKYPPRVKWLRPFWLPLAVAARTPDVLASRRADVTLLNRELVSTLVTLEPWTGRPRVLDVDDAIWLHRGGGFARRLARLADGVVAGNQVVADWFSQHNANVRIVPTAVDTDRFRPAGAAVDGPPTLGWSGTSSNFRFLEALQPALRDVLAARPDAVLRISSDRPPRLPDLPADRVLYEPWSLEREVPFLQSLDVGLMPLADDAWSRGKCAYKMLLYLSCGVAAAVSPVGMNVEVLEAADVGRGAADAAGWRDALLDLLADRDAARAMGARGRTLVEERYSLHALAPRLAGLLSTAARGEAWS